MSTALGASVLFALLVLGFTAVSAALGRRLVTAPLAFVAMGAVLGFVVGPHGRLRNRVRQARG